MPEDALIEESETNVLSVTWPKTFLNMTIDMSNGEGLITAERYLEITRDTFRTEVDNLKAEAGDDMAYDVSENKMVILFALC